MNMALDEILEQAYQRVQSVGPKTCSRTDRDD